jgi:small GTP-binding protein
LVEINNNILNEDDDIHEAGSSRVSKRKKNILNAKIIIVGDASVGKTSIIGRYINNSFDDKYQCTIQAQLNPKIINIDENTDLKLNIWDTAGQERYRSMTRMFYRDSQGAIIVFDLTKKDTFNDVQNWIKELKTHGCADTEIIILGNKSDLTNERDISDEDIKTVFKDYSYFEVSAKNGYNISLAFDKLRKLVVENIKAKDNNPTVKQRKLSHEKNKKGTLEDIERNIYKGTNKKSGKNKKCC